jgi:hypothetical protein
MRPSSGVIVFVAAAKWCSVSAKRNGVCEVLRGGVCTIIACACIRDWRVSLLVVGCIGCIKLDTHLPHVRKCEWPIVWAEEQFYPENRDVSSNYLSVYSYVGNRLKMSIELSQIVTEISDSFTKAILRSLG